MLEFDYNPECLPAERARVRAHVTTDNALLRAVLLWQMSVKARLPTVPARQPGQDGGLNMRELVMSLRTSLSRRMLSSSPGSRRQSTTANALSAVRDSNDAPQLAAADSTLLCAVDCWLGSTTDHCDDHGGSQHQQMANFAVTTIIAYTLRDLKARICAARAILSSVLRLPDDVLAMIFVERCAFAARLHDLGGNALHTTHPTGSRLDCKLFPELHTPFLLARVCRRWRNVALCTAEMWSCICVPLQKTMRVASAAERRCAAFCRNQLRRAGATKLQLILLLCPEGAYDGHIWNIIRPLLTRATHLHISAAWSTARSEAFMRGDATRLAHLSVSASVALPFCGAAPRLQSVVWHGPPPIWAEDGLSYPCVRSLTSRMCRYWRPIGMELFCRFPNVQHVETADLVWCNMSHTRESLPSHFPADSADDRYLLCRPSRLSMAALAALLNGPLQSVRHLSLSSEFAALDAWGDLPQALGAARAVESLTLSAGNSHRSQALADVLTHLSSPDSSSAWTLPRLRTLSILGFSLSTRDATCVVNLILARAGETGCVALRQVHMEETSKHTLRDAHIAVMKEGGGAYLPLRVQEVLAMQLE